MRREPRAAGLGRSRWRLHDLLPRLAGWRVTTPQGLGRILARLRLRWKRGRTAVHSPDPAYVPKVTALAAARQTAQTDPGTTLLFLDEVSLHRQPTIAQAWDAAGPTQTVARRSLRSDTAIRLVGALNATTGQLHTRRADRLSTAILVRLFADLVAAYPGQRLIVALDNWPLHVHADVLCALEPQTTPFPLRRAANWAADPSRAAQQAWGSWQLPIQLLPVPTYAPWTNPIERVWRLLRQDLGHLHPFADDLPALRTALDTWTAPFQAPSPRLLHAASLIPK